MAAVPPPNPSYPTPWMVTEPPQMATPGMVAPGYPPLALAHTPAYPEQPVAVPPSATLHQPANTWPPAAEQPEQPADPYRYAKEMYASLRAYQREICDAARARNCLVVMPTGTGKTLLAFCIAEHCRARLESERGVRKPVLFLTATRALCTQQRDMCIKAFRNAGRQEKGLSQRIVCTVTGDLSCLSAVGDDTEAGVVEYLFAIAGTVLQQVLQKGDSNDKLSRFSMVIFDEAHNVRGKSKGVHCMSYYHNLPKNVAPQVLGLTATPAFRREKFQSEVDELCNTLQCQVVTCQDEVNIRQMLTYAADAPPQVVPVLRTPKEAHLLTRLDICINQLWKTDLERFMHSPLYNHARDFPGLLRAFIDATELANQSTKNVPRLLGAAGHKDLPVCRALAVLQTLCEMKSITKKAGVRAAIDHWAARDASLVAVFCENTDDEPDRRRARQMETNDVNTICAMVDREFVELGASAEPVGSKELALLQLMKEEYERQGDGMRVLIFVEEIQDAIRMQERFTTLLDHTQYVIRRPTDGTIVPITVCDLTGKTAPSKLKETTNRFANGLVKVIFCTTVLEEGIDIPNCTLVVRYFMQSATVVSLNQCRGRARQEGATFVLLVENEDEEAVVKRHLDYGYILAQTREHMKRGASCGAVSALKYYDDKEHAELLLLYYCHEAVREGRMKEVPVLEMAKDTSVTIRLELDVRGEGRMVFLKTGQAMGSCKTLLIKEVCAYLDERGQLAQYPDAQFAGGKRSFDFKTFVTTSTALGATGEGDGAERVYRSAEQWAPYGKQPYDKLHELCAGVYKIMMEDDVQREANFCKLLITNRRHELVFTGYARGEGHRGYATRVEAIQNSALQVLMHFFKCYFQAEQAPKQLESCLPDKDNLTTYAFKAVSRPNYRTNKIEDIFVEVPGGVQAPPVSEFPALEYAHGHYGADATNTTPAGAPPVHHPVASPTYPAPVPVNGAPPVDAYSVSAQRAVSQPHGAPVHSVVPPNGVPASLPPAHHVHPGVGAATATQPPTSDAASYPYGTQDVPTAPGASPVQPEVHNAAWPTTSPETYAPRNPYVQAAPTVAAAAPAHHPSPAAAYAAPANGVPTQPHAGGHGAPPNGGPASVPPAHHVLGGDAAAVTTQHPHAAPTPSAAPPSAYPQYSAPPAPHRASANGAAQPAHTAPQHEEAASTAHSNGTSALLPPAHHVHPAAQPPTHNGAGPAWQPETPTPINPYRAQTYPHGASPTPYPAAAAANGAPPLAHAHRPQGAPVHSVVPPNKDVAPLPPAHHVHPGVGAAAAVQPPTHDAASYPYGRTQDVPTAPGAPTYDAASYPSVQSVPAAHGAPPYGGPASLPPAHHVLQDGAAATVQPPTHNGAGPWQTETPAAAYPYGVQGVPTQAHDPAGAALHGAPSGPSPPAYNCTTANGSSPADMRAPHAPASAAPANGAPAHGYGVQPCAPAPANGVTPPEDGPSTHAASSPPAHHVLQRSAVTPPEDKVAWQTEASAQTPVAAAAPAHHPHCASPAPAYAAPANGMPPAHGQEVPTQPHAGVHGAPSNGGPPAHHVLPGSA
eukprot:Rhum_TRINITY_DN14139_c0_g1::Rhum_TRINITY_DN14139_c0_g1_i2::g.70126::m.70126